MYRILFDAILLYNKLFGQLIEWEFEKRPCDACTFNNTFDDKKLNVQFHIGNYKQSIKINLLWTILWKN